MQNYKTVCPHSLDWLLDTLTHKEDLMFILNHSKQESQYLIQQQEKPNVNPKCADKKEINVYLEVKQELHRRIPVSLFLI